MPDPRDPNAAERLAAREQAYSDLMTAIVEAADRAAAVVAEAFITALADAKSINRG